MHRAFCDPTPHRGIAEVHAVADGLAVLTGVLNPEALVELRDAVWLAVERDRATGIPLIEHRRIDPDDRDIRLFDLVLNDERFRALLEHSVALHFARLLLGPKIRLSDFSANIAGLGSKATGMHAGQGYVTAPWPDWPLAVDIIWAIDAFTLENGATRVMPDSVRFGHGPEWDLDYPEATPLICPAGSIIVMDGRIWRQTGLNVSNDAGGVALFANYIRPWVLPRVDWSDRIPPALRPGFTSELRELLGFGTRATRNLQTRHGRQMWLDDPSADA
jgi:ectoine hydroxylase-related dioxygenase (phytanoyl-CoA dioxygenase family)